MKRTLTGIALTLVASVGWCQSFEVLPANPILIGESVSIRLTGLPAGEPVTITAERVTPSARHPSGAEAVYRSQASFMPAADGSLDLASRAPVSGDYREADIRGLFWSMKPVSAEKSGAPVPMQVRLVASVGSKALATTTIEFIEALPDLHVENVAEFPGAIFARPPGSEPRPAVILLGGSEGGNRVARESSPRLASRGFAVLGLPYYSPLRNQQRERELPELPAAFADIPVDRLQTAFEWLRRRPEVDASRVALYGTSKGAELALIGASRYSWVKAVVAIVPSDVVWEGWGPGVEPGTRSSFSFAGEPLPFVPYLDLDRELAGFQAGRDVRLRRPQDEGRAANPAAAVKARIPVERFKGPVLVIGGQDDQVWASAMMAQNIAETRARAGLETVALIFTDAGHPLGGNGWRPTTHYNTGPFKVGGTPEGNARAQAIAYPRTIEFLRQKLGVK